MGDLRPYFENLGLGGWRFYKTIGSTNDLALEWAGRGAQDWSLVVAENQTAGRGRGGRHWLSQPGCGLTFSLILRPTVEEMACFPRFTALAALGLVGALAELGLTAQVKWPNDILLENKKVAGILVEADWVGEHVDIVVIGMGVNVSPCSVPSREYLRYQAISIENVLENRIDRWALLAAVIQKMREYRTILTSGAFIRIWNAHLVLRGETVHFKLTDGELLTGLLAGVNQAGELEIQKSNGELVTLIAGEILIVNN